MTWLTSHNRGDNETSDNPSDFEDAQPKGNRRAQQSQALQQTKNDDNQMQQQQQQPPQQQPQQPQQIPQMAGGRIAPVRQSRILDRPVKPDQKDSSLKIKIELDLEVEVDLYARVKGDVTIGLM
jgi:hypothetical protein